MLGLMLEHHPHGLLADLYCVLASSSHRPIPSGVGASNIPGAVHDVCQGRTREGHNGDRVEWRLGPVSPPDVTVSTTGPPRANSGPIPSAHLADAASRRSLLHAPWTEPRSTPRLLSLRGVGGARQEPFDRTCCASDGVVRELPASFRARVENLGSAVEDRAGREDERRTDTAAGSTLLGFYGGSPRWLSPMREALLGHAPRWI